MKKKFILLAMMLLTLIGGVNLNVLNAQDDVKTINGDAVNESSVFPIPTYQAQCFNQTIYKASEIGHDAATITSIAFKKNSDDAVRKFAVYMLNTDKETLSGFEEFSDEDRVYYNESLTTSSVDGWMTLELEKSFDYEGGNIILITWDRTGSTSWKNGCMYSDKGSGNYCSWYSTNSTLNESNYLSYSYSQSTRQPALKLYFEPADNTVPAAPTNLAVAECTHNSVSLTWDAAENAKKYNVHVYNNGVEITGSPFTSTETAYTVEGLDAETTYTFKVQSVRGKNLSENFSNEASAKTLEAPETRNVVFKLTDSYGDSWNGNKLNVYLNGILEHSLENQELDGQYQTPETQTIVIPIIVGTLVRVEYQKGYGSTYPDENSFEIYYEDGTPINGMEKIYEQCASNTTTHDVVTFTVESLAPEVTIAASAYNIYSDQTATLTATAANFDGDVAYSWSPAENLSDASISNPVFTPTSTGSFEFTCTVTDANNNEASASVTINVTERPALALDVTADKTEIYQGQNTMIYASAIGGFPAYSFNWLLNGEEYGTGSSFYFDQTEVGEYTITCKVTDDNGGTIEKSVTVNVLENKLYGKQFRIKALSYNTKDANGNYAGPNPFQNDMYLHITSHSSTDEALVWVLPYEETPNQKFTFELTNTDNVYNLRSADGFYLHCYNWNVGAYSTYQYTASPIGISYIDDTEFYLMNGSKYFKAEYGDDGNYKVYCDFDQQAKTATWVLEEVLPVIENLMASDTQLYPGGTTTLTWGTFEGAASYNIYVNGELKYNTTETSYELSGLAYNMNPGHKIEVVALNENGDVISGKPSVTVQVAGTFTLTVNVTDGTNPIEGATVNIDMAYAYDEFKNQVSPVTVEPTGADGKTTIELPILCNEDGFYNNNGYWVTSYYTVAVSRSPYQDNNWNYINYYEDVTSGYTMDIVLALPTVSNIQFKDEKGEYLYDVMEGTNVVLSWDAVEGADAYKVYKLNAGEVESSETVTGTTYTIEGVWKGHQYAVSALFGELESEKSYASLQVKGIGYFKGYVTDGTKALQGIQVKVSSEYGDVSAVATTNEEGYFNGEIMEGNYYVLTISHSDYEEFTSETFAIGYEQESDFGTITLTAKPSASGITEVTATLNGENVVVNWTVDEAYTKYNVYRRLAGTQGKGDNIAQDVAVTSYTDAAWETLEPGTYQYGVSAFVEPQAQTRGTEVIFEEGFENTNTETMLPDGWTKYKDNSSASSTPEWKASKQGLTTKSTPKNGEYSLYSRGACTSTEYYYCVTPLLDFEVKTLSFYYVNPNWGTYSVLDVCYSEYPNGPWESVFNSKDQSEWTHVELDLSNKGLKQIYVAFKNSDNYGYGIGIDDVRIVGESISSEVETQIVWSNDVVKQGPNTFEGTVSTDWNVAENWSNGVVPATGDEVIVNAEAVISSAVNVSNVTINAGTSLTVANGGALTVTGTISQASDYLLVLEEGGQIFQNNNNVTARFRMSIDNPTDWSNTSNKDGWQFISMPMTDVAYDWFTGADEEYDLYKYDGSQELEWLNHKAGSFAETEFISGKGYLASLKDNTTATVYGTLNAATSQQWGPYYMYDKDFANLQLIGNPFTFDIKWSDFAISGVYYDSELEEVIDNVPYFVDGYAIVDNNGNYKYYTSADNESIKVGQGFFVKLLATQVSLKYNKTRTITRESNNSLNITATGNAGKDNVVINFAGKSEGFDKLQNFNDAIATVYVAEDGKNYGIYNCDADVQEVELSFNANKMGNYTISIEPNGKFETVTLVDRFTGIETNMLVEDYNFTAMSEENPNRFIVRFANGQQTTDNSHFVYQSGEELILNIQGEVQIVDVLGRVVYNGEAMNDINRINVSSFNSGAYMVKVMNGNEVKVEKVVIY